MHTEQNKLMYHMDMLQDPPVAVHCPSFCFIIETQSFLIYVVQNW